MKNYYLIEELKELNNLNILECIDIAQKDLDLYIKNLQGENKKRYKIVNELSLIKMYTFLITLCEGYKFVNQESPSYKIKLKEEETSLLNNSNKIIKHIRCIFDEKYSNNLNDSMYFINILNQLENKAPNINHVWYVFCKKNAEIIYNKEIGWESFYKNNMMCYVLMNDINNGTFIITINKETRILSKKGEYFIFPYNLEYSINFSGDFCTFLHFTIDSNYEN